MPAWSRLVTVRLYPNQVHPSVGEANGPCAWMCREQLQHFDTSRNVIAANVDTTGTESVICGVNVGNFIKDNPRCARIRIGVILDYVIFPSFEYTPKELQACGYELMTGDLHIRGRKGRIRINFEAWGTSPIDDLRRLAFDLNYYKDEENLPARMRVVRSVLPPILAYEYSRLNGTITALRLSTNRYTKHAPSNPSKEVVQEGKDSEYGKERRDCPSPRMGRSRARHQRHSPQSENRDEVLSRQRSVSRERYKDSRRLEKRQNGSKMDNARRSRSPDSRHRELSPARKNTTLQAMEMPACENRDGEQSEKSALDSIKRINKKLELEIEQLNLIKEQMKLKKELQALQQEICDSQDYTVHQQCSSLPICSRPLSIAPLQQAHEGLAITSVLPDVTHPSLSSQAGANPTMQGDDSEASKDELQAAPSASPSSVALIPESTTEAASSATNGVHITEADLDKLRNIREQLYRSLNVQAKQSQE